jgi:hypothetical protein
MSDCCNNPDIIPLANPRDPSGTVHGFECRNCGESPNQNDEHY